MYRYNPLVYYLIAVWYYANLISSLCPILQHVGHNESEKSNLNSAWYIMGTRLEFIIKSYGKAHLPRMVAVGWSSTSEMSRTLLTSFQVEIIRNSKELGNLVILIVHEVFVLVCVHIGTCAFIQMHAHIKIAICIGILIICIDEI